MKAAGRRIVMLTCYDAAFARLLEQAEVDVLLVGDSVNQVLAGQETTLERDAGPDDLPRGLGPPRRAPRAGLRGPAVSHLPGVPTEAIRNAGRVLQESGAHGVKLEGGRPMAETVRALVDRGIPVIGPSRTHPAVGARARRLPGAGARAASRRAAPGGRRALEEAGACAIVLELMPAALANRVIAGAHDPHDRHRRRARAATGRCWCCTTCSASTRCSIPSSSSATPSWARRCAPPSGRTPPRCATGTYPGPEHSFD